jgi:hypothetical protein
VAGDRAGERKAEDRPGSVLIGRLTITGALHAYSTSAVHKSRNFSATFCALKPLTQRNQTMKSASAHLKMRGGGIFTCYPKSFSEPRFPNLRMESRTIVDRFLGQKLEESGVEQK